MRATRALLRVLTLALLAVLLVGVPVLVVRLIGMPLPGAHQMRAAWQHRRVDGDLVLRIGAAVFSVLWLWFALTALAELWNVLSWRLGGSRARLAPVPPGPSGWVRALVRFVAVSSVSATAALGSLVPVARTASAVAPRTPVASAVVSSNSSAAAHAGRPTHQANGRETPFSLARELGRPELRDRIIELNSGRQAPDGSAWQGGVFPLGMKVVLPEEVDARPAAQVAPHAVAQAVPTLLGAAHEVEAGDCYWQIADDHLAGVLDRDPTPPEVLAYTNALIEFNDDLLGHRDPTLIVPGELVILTDAGLPHDGSVAAPTVVPAAPALPGPPVVPVVPAAVPEVPAVPEVAAVPEVPVVPELAAVPEVPGVATAELPAESPPPGDVGVPAVPPASEQAFPAVPVAPVAPDRPAAPVAPVAPDRPAAPAPAAVAPATAAVPGDSSGVLSYAAGLGTALLMSAGALSLLESRRRRQWRAATVGSRLALPTVAQARTEVLLRSLSAPERLARLDVALRAAAPDLAAQGASVHAVLLSDTGEVCLFVRGSATPSQPEWQTDLHANTWRLPAGVPLTALAERARRCTQPCPAIAHIGGVPEGGELFVDLEAVGVLAVQSPHSALILRGIASSLAVSPFAEAARVYTVGLGDVALGSPTSEPVDSLDAALEAAAMALGSTASLAHGSTTFGLRVAGAGGEAWEPAVVVAAVADADVAGGDDDRADDDRADDDRADDDRADDDRAGRGGPVVVLEGEMRAAAAGGRGLALVLDAPGTAATWRLHFTGGRHVLEPLGIEVQPVGLAVADVAEVAELLAESSADRTGPADEPAFLGGAGDHAEIAGGRAMDVSELALEFDEPDWALMVHVLGQVAVVGRDGTVADCERSKAVELVVWLSQHRERPTRTAARTALWDLDVRDATFANVVSDARRAMARAVPPAEGQEWIARTLTEELPLHRRVVTDAELLEQRLRHSRGLSPLDAIAVLRPGMELVVGMPFAGTSYLWTDAEGITSSLVLLATGASIELARHYLSLGDVDGVFWATGQGLKVISGHEELIALRMRAHARHGDLAGVRGEWESYERALAADPWAAADPAPKLVALRRELLTPAQPSDAAANLRGAG